MDLNGNGSHTPISGSEDKELTLAFKRGEKGAYQQIYDRHSARVHGICRRMLSNPQDAEEAAQESMLRVYTALGRFNGRYQLGAWIARITTNVCLDHIRARSRRPHDIAPIELADTDLRLSEQDGDPESLYIRRIEARHVKKVLDQLPAMHRAAIVLRDFEGLSYSDIAVALEITEPQVKALLHRARGGFKRSWSTSGVAAFLPWNLVARFRKPDPSFVEPATNAASSAGHIAQIVAPASNMAVSCASALQQCGQVFSERFVTAATAVIVGTATITGVAMSNASPREPERAAAAAERPRVRKSAEVESKKIHRIKTKRTETAQEPESAPIHESADSAPAPAPTHAGDDSESADEEPQPHPKPTYGPVQPVLGWDRGQPVPPTVPVGNDMVLDCGGRSFSQSLETVIHDGDMSYPATLSIELRESLRIQLTVLKDGREITYDGGASQLVSAGSGQDTEWGAIGSYSFYGPDNPRDVGLPAYGRFTLRLSLDCMSNEVVAESLTLTQD